jgi:phospholipid/cholesterol/gamma-HCH transport system permease protein
MIQRSLYHLGRFLILLRSGFKRPENWKMYRIETVRQMNDIGIGSLLIVVLIAIFIGAVTALQFSYQLDGTLVPDYYIGYVVRDMVLIELAPTFTCLVLAGKVGSNMATELGGMRQKEHIDAMEIMGVNTAGYLILPKLVAALVVIPLLVTLAAGIGMFGGYASSVFTGVLSHETYIQGLLSFFVPYNIFMMYVKALVYAFILTSVSVYQGYYVSGGSIELGKASTNAVVFSDILILLADYIITVVLTA